MTTETGCRATAACSASSLWSTSVTVDGADAVVHVRPVIDSIGRFEGIVGVVGFHVGTLVIGWFARTVGVVDFHVGALVTTISSVRVWRHRGRRARWM